MTQRMKCVHIKRDGSMLDNLCNGPRTTGNTSTDRDDSYTALKSHGLTARETGQRDRWLGKEVGFIDKQRCQDTMRSKRFKKR